MGAFYDRMRVYELISPLYALVGCKLPFAATPLAATILLLFGGINAGVQLLAGGTRHMPTIVQSNDCSATMVG